MRRQQLHVARVPQPQPRCLLEAERRPLRCPRRRPCHAPTTPLTWSILRPRHLQARAIGALGQSRRPVSSGEPGRVRRAAQRGKRRDETCIDPSVVAYTSYTSSPPIVLVGALGRIDYVCVPTSPSERGRAPWSKVVAATRPLPPYMTFPTARAMDSVMPLHPTLSQLLCLPAQRAAPSDDTS